MKQQPPASAVERSAGALSPTLAAGLVFVASGAVLGGRAADWMDPRRLVVLLLIGGGLVLLTVLGILLVIFGLLLGLYTRVFKLAMIVGTTLVALAFASVGLAQRSPCEKETAYYSPCVCIG